MPFRVGIDTNTTGFDVLYPPYGSVEGPQFGDFPRAGKTGLYHDNEVSNFRFNPAYKVDLVFWREIMGQVTDAIYVKPHLNWDIVPGLSLDESVIYSQALDSLSTPSAQQAGNGTDADPYRITNKGQSPLGIELDSTLRYTAGDGFVGWASWGVFQPLPGLGTSLSRGHVLTMGLAVKF
jgi:uncharacterized protein (TIGR04551 family)